jgi:5-methylthioribose kinase
MNFMEFPEEVSQYVIHKGWVNPTADIQVTPLTGGVSNQVWKIETSDGIRWVMKQALAKLKVQVDWYSDVERIIREQDAMMAIAKLVPQQAIPHIVHQDAQAYVYVMTCAPDDAVTWKSLLLQGQYDRDIAAQAGSLLKSIHLGSQTLEEKHQLEDIRFFQQLRIDPFYIYLREGAYRAYASRIDDCIDQLLHARTALVHGDFSPKNMLVAQQQVILLDYEVAHWGNPVFDLAFCMAHLLLKGIVFNREQPSLALIEGFLDGYGVKHSPNLHAHLGVMLLARVDGKSPVEYVRTTELKDQIRKLGVLLLTSSQTTDIVQQIGSMRKGIQA